MIDSKLNDADLVKLIKDVPSEGLNLAIELYGSSVKTICSSILSGYSNEDIDEVISDVFACLWRGINNYNPNRTGLKTYVYGIARICAKNRKRSILKLPIYEDYYETDLSSNNDIDDDFIEKTNIEIMKKLILELKHPANYVFFYRFFEGLKVEEIAKELCINPKKVENILCRYKPKLKKQFEKKGII